MKRKTLKIPETMAELAKIAPDVAYEKRCKLRFLGNDDGSFLIFKDGEAYLFEETREITVVRLYYKLLWLLGE